MIPGHRGYPTALDATPTAMKMTAAMTTATIQ
jgi:hypothetical protein